MPRSHPECLSGKTFVITGVLDSLERPEAEDLIKRHGGRVTGSVSGKTSFLLVGMESGSSKTRQVCLLVVFAGRNGWACALGPEAPMSNDGMYSAYHGKNSHRVAEWVFLRHEVAVITGDTHYDWVLQLAVEPPREQKYVSLWHMGMFALLYGYVCSTLWVYLLYCCVGPH
jgi:hypothetical protein